MSDVLNTPPIKHQGLQSQVANLRYVLDRGWVSDWRLAVDGGAYNGWWTQVMLERFERVIAFEPVEEHYKDIAALLGNHPKLTLLNKALLDGPGKVTMKQSSKGTDYSRWAKRDEDGTVDAIALDSLKLPFCDLLKLDLEGAEHFALMGAKETIKRCLPTIMVEKLSLGGKHYGKEHFFASISDFLKELKYDLVADIRPDTVWVPSRELKPKIKKA